MRIAIDSGLLTGGHSVRGIGVMVREQINALKNLKTKEQKNIKIDAFDFQSENGKWRLENGKYDIVHYPYFFPYAMTLPDQKLGKKVVVTIQDLIQLVYPKNYPPGIRGKINFIKQKARLKNIDTVITISETSKKDIVRFLGIPPENIHVVYLAPKRIFKRITDKKSLIALKRKHNLPDRFVIYVGDVNFNKNIPNLIKACKLAKIPLVICGKQALDIEQGLDLKLLRGPRDWFRYLFNVPHPELAHYGQLIEEFKDNKEIARLGFVSDDDLVALYNLASVYVQPSFYEGFGLPVLEAMACGCPLVVAKTNALVEIAGSAALIADPKNPKDMAGKITKVLANPNVKDILINKGFDKAKEFTWEKTARKMIEVYKFVDSSK